MATILNVSSEVLSLRTGAPLAPFQSATADTTQEPEAGYVADGLVIVLGSTPAPGPLAANTVSSLSYAGTYDATKTYVTGQVVFNGVFAYLALPDGSGNVRTIPAGTTPASNPTYWQSLTGTYDVSGQAGLYLTPHGSLGNSSATLSVSNQINVVRFIPEYTLTITKIAFNVTAASGTDDPCDVGIYDVNGNLLKNAGSATGRLFSANIKNVSLTSSLTLNESAVYYAALVNTVTTTGPSVGTYSTSVAGNASLFGATQGTLEVGKATGSSSTLPATLPALTAASFAPFMAGLQ